MDAPVPSSSTCLIVPSSQRTRADVVMLLPPPCRSLVCSVHSGAQQQPRAAGDDTGIDFQLACVFHNSSNQTLEKGGKKESLSKNGGRGYDFLLAMLGVQSHESARATEAMISRRGNNDEGNENEKKNSKQRRRRTRTPKVATTTKRSRRKGSSPLRQSTRRSSQPAGPARRTGSSSNRKPLQRALRRRRPATPSPLPLESPPPRSPSTSRGTGGASTRGPPGPWSSPLQRQGQ